MSQLANLSAYQDRINRILNNKINELAITDETLLNAMQYALLIGGKRMRPYLCYITGDALGADLTDLDAIAAALECIHAYSLIHDDLPAMDDDNLRRGKPTCHIEFDEATAILAGDSLQTLAFDFLANASLSSYAESQRIELIRQLCQASGYQGMCGGQAIDLSATNKAITLTELETMHRLKTGALLVACVTMAATCVENVSNETLNSLKHFAENIGLAYQVRDDIIDITSDEKTLGKPKGSDQQANKSTYPSLLGLDGANAKAQHLYQVSLQALTALPYNTQNLSEFATFIISRDS